MAKKVKDEIVEEVKEEVQEVQEEVVPVQEPVEDVKKDELEGMEKKELIQIVKELRNEVSVLNNRLKFTGSGVPMGMGR